ncbi:sugar nucleotidyltransferase [Salinispora arenicola]|uniref:Glucose-1-phosphate thymidylyltransferase n=1 Tax=Salinispora arenicola TaxID=168697 RepID=A0A542XSX3_SALAC|nr:sugar phosphate nucleotidyltransferase [Salinispora arenicola]MCN0151182.1 sugar phosphate nucleotidyltransferase [Salinispora arenicola]MCN0176790.1 sugar phosphate nucleotidyltransferase [Salinispora arenicola]TQL38940.1 glucose-1-phosphate thymidylyltransferase [Salinispora arenicola]
MRGVLLAGGTGSRMWPVTRVVSKQLVPVYDKPMIFYPLCTLVRAGVREILIITRPDERDLFGRLLGDGSQWGLDLRYADQERPQGIAHALLVAADFLVGGSALLLLGDNIIHSVDLDRHLAAADQIDGGLVFGVPVADPRPYGVLDVDERGVVRDIVEKPLDPPSHYAVPGVYGYGQDVVEVVAGLTRSPRGELEITDVNREYLRQGRLRVRLLQRGTAWLDTGRFDDLMAAAEYVRVVQERDGVKVGCIEEAAWRAGLLDDAAVRQLAIPLRASGYGDYLLRLLDGPRPARSAVLG